MYGVCSHLHREQAECPSWVWCVPIHTEKCVSSTVSLQRWSWCFHKTEHNCTSDHTVVEHEKSCVFILYRSTNSRTNMRNNYAEHITNTVHNAQVIDLCVLTVLPTNTQSLGFKHMIGLVYSCTNLLNCLIRRRHIHVCTCMTAYFMQDF